jgi:tRNA pseudouridine38-40 synthase
MRIALALEYDGRDFCGWQRQSHAPSLQAALEAALFRIAGHALTVVCAGRTDTGVHATHQVVHFDTDARRPMNAWVRGSNRFLPSGMTVLWAREVLETFHARYSAQRRRYRYLLLNRPQRPGLCAGRAGWFHAPLDLAAMRDAARHLVGTHDFSAFRAAECQAKTPVKHMFRAEIVQSGALIGFEFEANAFLQHMVRNLVGSLVHVGKGAWRPEDLRGILEEGDRRRAAATFSPDGLYFLGPLYDPSLGLPEPPESSWLTLTI